MHRTHVAIGTMALVGLFTVPALGQWVQYTEDTAVRLPTGPGQNDPSLTTADPEEKDYAWGDVDNDGDIDVVVVRKEPFTSTGKRVNVLLMNEGVAEGHPVNGVFIDRTSDYATASDVPGDFGFLTPTNDRDVQLSDLDGDGWLDMVTAVTLTDNQAKHLSHPRIYMNLGEDGGVWQGFRYEDARIPQMHPTAGPRFCSVSAGDVTGDGKPDLYFGDYDSGGSQIFDFNNRLLINDGNGFFTDETASRLTSEMSLAAFGAASIIADVNNDSRPDIIKQTSLNAPTHVAITYNSANLGFFNNYDTIYDLAPYFVAEGDLNNDGRLDLVIVDDGTDRVMINNGGPPGGAVSWTTASLPSAPSGGFGGNAIVRDLNNDGLQDIITTDVDVDIPGCSRAMQFYRNLGGSNPGLVNDNPISARSGTHDVAVFDINMDGWLDLFVGRCGSTEIYINVPPAGLVFNYPNGAPVFIEPDVPHVFEVQVAAFGGAQPEPGSGTIFISENDGPFVEFAMEDLGDDLYRATLPATACPETVQFYVEAQSDTGGVFRDPSDAPGTPFTATGAYAIEISVEDDIEADVSDWTIINDPSLTSGAWEQATPLGTIAGAGGWAAPPNDATAGSANTQAFITENGLPGGSSGAADVDGGPTTLISPAFDLAGTDGVITYSRWMFCDTEGTAFEDVLTTWISNDDGANWTEVISERVINTGGEWESRSFFVSEWITPTDQMRIRFEVSDEPNTSVTEAGIDNFQVEKFICEEDAPCPGDTDGDDIVGFADLLSILAAWGPCDDPENCPQDLDGDGEIAFADLLATLAAWGPCP